MSSHVLQAAVNAAIGQTAAAAGPGVRWSISIRHDGRPVAGFGGQDRLRTASMGKVFLLLQVARRIADGSIDPGTVLHADGVEGVADSGLSQYFATLPLTVEAACVLVASVSDNLATNVLLDAVGLPAVTGISQALGMQQTGMLDRIRDVRGPQHPQAPSMGRADDLALLMELIWTGEAVGPSASERVRDWLALGTDLSMVASAFGLDPLAHRAAVPALMNKTGTDIGVRADAGAVASRQGCICYAVIANWQPDRLSPDQAVPDQWVPDQATIDRVLGAMRAIGEAVRTAIG